MTALAPLPSRPVPWALVERAQAGDRDALAAIYAEHRPRLYKFVRFRTGSNRVLAEDLTSETFTRALARLGGVTYQGRDIGAWLITIARNLIADHFKSGRVRFEATTADMLDADQVDEHTEWQPDVVAASHELSAVMAAAIARLTEEQQRVIRLRFYAGLSVVETAELLSVTPDVVKVRTYRAVRSLGRFLGPEWGLR